MVKQVVVLVESREVNVHKVTLLIDESISKATTEEAVLNAVAGQPLPAGALVKGIFWHIDGRRKSVMSLT